MTPHPAPGTIICPPRKGPGWGRSAGVRATGPARTPSAARGGAERGRGGISLLRFAGRPPVARLWALASLVLALFLFSPAHASPPATSEYQVKAAFLYNFLKFVDWPSDGMSTPGTICLGVLGRDPFEGALDEVQGKSAKGRKVVVVHYRTVEEAKGCDLLFISASEKGRLSQILKQTQNSRLLTVADQEGFCEAGGMINLVSIKNRVGFDVNVAAASRARLKISSQLLKLARTVFE
jgi:hypothetical protein